MITISDSTEANKLFDTEGVDMTSQFLSLKKKRRGQLKKDDFFDNTFDIREFFTRKKQSIISSQYSQQHRGTKKSRPNSRKRGTKMMMLTTGLKRKFTWRISSL